MLFLTEFAQRADWKDVGSQPALYQVSMLLLILLLAAVIAIGAVLCQYCIFCNVLVIMPLKAIVDRNCTVMAAVVFSNCSHAVTCAVSTVSRYRK